MGFFFLAFFFLLLIVDSVGVQLLTATYKHCCRILLSLLQVLGLLCCNFRASVFCISNYRSYFGVELSAGGYSRHRSS